MLTALIVEDEPLMREYLLLNLSSIHDQWKTGACARDGIEAMELLNKHKFDLVITDIRMPRMGGLELAAFVHNNIVDTDIIFLTGYDEFDYARAAVRAGGRGLSAKAASRCGAARDSRQTRNKKTLGSHAGCSTSSCAVGSRSPFA